LRGAYSDIVAAADVYPRQAAVLGILEVQARSDDNWECSSRSFRKRIGVPATPLLLSSYKPGGTEPSLTSCRRSAPAHLVFLAILGKHARDGTTVADDEFERRIADLNQKAEALATAARSDSLSYRSQLVDRLLPDGCSVRD
jgi:hypothetical protein